MPSTSVYLPEEIAIRLKEYSQKLGAKQSTNNIIVAALTEYLNKHQGRYEWSKTFLSWGDGNEEPEGLEIERTDWRDIEL